MILAGYDWEHLIEERNCELAASFEVFIYRLLFLEFTPFFYYYIGFSFSKKFAVQ
jgi:hypothetical protein